MKMALKSGITRRLTTLIGVVIQEQTGTNTVVHSNDTSIVTTRTTMITNTATIEATTISIMTHTTMIHRAASTTTTTIHHMTILTNPKRTTALITM